MTTPTVPDPATSVHERLRHAAEKVYTDKLHNVTRGEAYESAAVADIVRLEAEVARLRANVDAAGKQTLAWAERYDRVRVQRDEARAEAERLRWALVYRPNGRCRICAGFENNHRMHCRHYGGAVTHAWTHTVQNGTFGGTDYLCSCGGSYRQGGMAGDGDEPVCPKAAETQRGPAAVDQMATPTAPGATVAAQNGEVVPVATPDLAERLTPRIVELVLKLIQEELR